MIVVIAAVDVAPIIICGRMVVIMIYHICFCMGVLRGYNMPVLDISSEDYCILHHTI